MDGVVVVISNVGLAKHEGQRQRERHIIKGLKGGFRGSAHVSKSILPLYISLLFSAQQQREMTIDSRPLIFGICIWQYMATFEDKIFSNPYFV